MYCGDIYVMLYVSRLRDAPIIQSVVCIPKAPFVQIDSLTTSTSGAGSVECVVIYDIVL